MSSSSDKKQSNVQPKTGAEALGGPIEVGIPSKPAVPKLDLNRLKQVEQQINDSLKKNRSKPSRGRIDIEI